MDMFHGTFSLLLRPRSALITTGHPLYVRIMAAPIVPDLPSIGGGSSLPEGAADFNGAPSSTLAWSFLAFARALWHRMFR
jgi:hypothetical protein